MPGHAKFENKNCNNALSKFKNAYKFVFHNRIYLFLKWQSGTCIMFGLGQKVLSRLA